MKFESFYSSSRANFYVVTAANGKRLLIECGCTWKKLLKALDYKLENVVGCLLSHEHKDHSHCVEDVLEAGIDVYASRGTFDAIEESLHLHRKAKVIEDRLSFNILCGPDGVFTVLPFVINHDATEPMGFVIHEWESENDLLFVTDTSYIKQKFALQFEIIALCCNYDGEILAKLEAADKINTELAKRLLTSHMEKEVTKSYLRDCCNLGKCTEIHLLHMSGGNIDQEKIRAEIEDEFFIKTLIAGA